MMKRGGERMLSMRSFFPCSQPAQQRDTLEAATTPRLMGHDDASDIN